MGETLSKDIKIHKNKYNNIKNQLNNVYCRLSKSKIHGIGVIAIKDIPKGINPFKYKINIEGKFYNKNKLLEMGIEKDILRMYEDYWCHDINNRVFIPNNFNSIPTSFECFLNHSDNANLNFKNNKYKTKKLIKRGEELTADYTKQSYLEQPEKDWK